MNKVKSLISSKKSFLKDLDLSQHPISEDNAKKIFDNFDKDKDGILNEAEGKNFLSEYLKKSKKVVKHDEFASRFGVNGTVTLKSMSQNSGVDTKEESKKPTGWSIGEYKISNVLGQGGYAVVVAGHKDKGDGVVAIKITLQDGHGDKIEEESDILNAIGEHTNLVGLEAGHAVESYTPKTRRDPIEIANGINDEGTKACLKYELCENGTLFDLVSMAGGFSETVARTYMRQLVEAVSFMHKKNFAHRDLKAENLLLGSNWELKVADLGLSAITEGGYVVDGKRAGTQGYMGPEVHQNKRYGFANDVFAMGVICFCFVLARPPFTDSKQSCPWWRKVAQGDWNTYWRWQGQGGDLSISDGFKDFIQRFFEPDQDKRITVEQIQSHKWYNGEHLGAKELQLEMRGYADQMQQTIFEQRDELDAAATQEYGNDTHRGEDDVPKLMDWNISPGNENDKRIVEIPVLHTEEGTHRGEDDNKEEAEPLPYESFVRVYTKFKSSESASSLYSQLQAVCEKKSIEVELGDNYLLQCALNYSDDICQKFDIQIFKDGESNLNIVEFGRRGGDGARFRNIFVTFQKSMIGYVHSGSKKNTSTASTTTTTTTTAVSE